MTRALNAGIATVEVHGEPIEVPSVAQCRVCSSKYREEADRLLVGPHTYDRMVKLLPKGADLSARNLADHFRNGHVPVEAAALVSLRDREAAERGRALEPVADAVAERIVSGIPVARRILERVSERLEADELPLSARDALAAAEFLERYDCEGVLDQGAILSAIRALMDEARAVMNIDQWAIFSRNVWTNEVIRGAMPM